jgi:Yip1 domain
MTEAVGSPAPAPSQGLVARFIGVLTSPRATFEGVVKAPRPVGVLFIVALLTAAAVAGPQFTARGRQAVLDMQVQQAERFRGQPLDDAAYSRLEQMSRYSPYLSLASIFIFTPIGALIFGGVFWAIFNALLGGTASYKQVLAVVTHSMVINAVGTVAGAPIQYIQGTMSQTGPFNLGALAPMLDENSFLAHFLGYISVFGIWGIVVTAIGFGVLYKRKSSTIAITLMVIYLLIAGGVAVFMSR